MISRRLMMSRVLGSREERGGRWIGIGVGVGVA